ncbi:MAG: HYR domain-containing protein, partial [Armatimonadetes bacterium]|nr:HYR domain-containing protein [Armatimonadota bacterium]
ATQTVTVTDTTPPSITAPTAASAEQASADGTAVELAGPTVSDVCDADVEVGNDAPGVFPLGDTVVAWTATDDSGNAATAEQTVTVVDTTPPELTLTVPAPTIPATSAKALVLAARVTDVRDICDADPDVVITVTSNEPIKGRGGKSPDWMVVRNGSVWEIWVRAESSGPSTDRIYTITATATDSSGRSTRATGVVTVPDPRGKKK